MNERMTTLKFQHTVAFTHQSCIRLYFIVITKMEGKRVLFAIVDGKLKKALV